MQSIFAFLGVDDSFAPETSLRLNVSGSPRVQKLNSFLSHSGQTKEILKRVIPYGIGLSMQQRLRNWNLRTAELSDQARSEAGSFFAYDPKMVARLAGLDLASRWEN
jgi:hypothetical protein